MGSQGGAPGAPLILGGHGIGGDIHLGLVVGHLDLMGLARHAGPELRPAGPAGTVEATFGSLVAPGALERQIAGDVGSHGKQA